MMVAWDFLTPADGSMATYSWNLWDTLWRSPSQMQTLIILLMDNHDSHLNVRVIEHCKKIFLTLLTFLPDCLYKLQPLDIGVLSPFKNILKGCFSEWLQLYASQHIFQSRHISEGSFCTVASDRQAVRYNSCFTTSPLLQADSKSRRVRPFP